MLLGVVNEDIHTVGAKLMVATRDESDAPAASNTCIHVVFPLVEILQDFTPIEGHLPSKVEAQLNAHSVF
ncbi:hypothetical protein PsorP6_000735 [Peronosclerospora sorghi]|uniref:Uncharacterized protein n=1 Tax=Peronosclerospora sorghi TaxID=230839 RepID=A0ACC0WTA6_9STRA|nr:hypothetical protein PsorP6_000735 [Peronosclerospora sorghi]